MKSTETLLKRQSQNGASVDTALDVQVGGGHYKKYPIQPIQYAMANKLNYCQANAVKYVTRCYDKGGKEDLEKAIHNIQLLIELEFTDKE